MCFIREYKQQLSHSPTWCCVFHFIQCPMLVLSLWNWQRCSLLPWDLSCLFIGPTGTATMAPDINQARRRCSVLSCRTHKGVTHTHADHKETDCGWWRRWQGQHLCDKALTVSLFSLQPANAGSCWNKYRLTPLGSEPTMGRCHKNSKQVKTVAAVPVTCW